MAVTSFTSVCRLRPDVEAAAARHTLSELGVGTRSPFAASTRTHYARLQILDEFRVHTRRPLAQPKLLWSNDVDGDVRSYLVEILSVSRGTLGPVLALCADAPQDPADSEFVDRAAEFLLGHELRIGLQYTNSPGRSASEVRRAVDQRRKLAGFALAYQQDSPSVRRAAFVETFEIDLRERVGIPEPVVADVAEPVVVADTGDQSTEPAPAPPAHVL